MAAIKVLLYNVVLLNNVFDIGWYVFPEYNSSMTFQPGIWHGHVSRRMRMFGEKKCMDYKVQCVRTRGRSKKTQSEVVGKDFRSQQLNKEDGMDHSRWSKLIKH